jgi:hypothetical protein
VQEYASKGTSILFSRKGGVEMHYQIMFYGGLAGAIITLGISIIVFVKLNISKVIEHLTGYSFRRARKKSRKTKYQEQDLAEKRTTNEIKIRKNVVEHNLAVKETAATEWMGEEIEPTALMAVEKVEETELLVEETTLLDQADETTLISVVSEEDENNRFFRKEADIMIVHSEMII